MDLNILFIFCNYFSAFLFSISTVFQIYKVIKLKQTIGVMLTTVLIRFVGFFVFLIYLLYFEIYHTVYSVVCQSIITAILIIVVCYYRYYKRVDDVDFSMYLLPN